MSIIGKWFWIDDDLIQIIGKQPTHPEGKIWTTITVNEEVKYYSDNDLKQANETVQIHTK